MRTPRSKSLPLAIGAAVLAIGLIVGGTLAGRAIVHASAIESEVTGTISPQEDGSVAIDDGFSTYRLIGAFDFTPFLAETVVLTGRIKGGTMYVSEVALGAIHVQNQGGTAIIDTTGTVEEGSGGFEMTVEGITLTLVENDELSGAVGHGVQIQGELTGAWVAVSDLTLVE